MPLPFPLGPARIRFSAWCVWVLVSRTARRGGERVTDARPPEDTLRQALVMAAGLLAGSEERFNGEGASLLQWDALAEGKQILGDGRAALAVLLAERDAARSENERLRDLSELAVSACLPLLPLRGSWLTGYRLEERVETTLSATPEEWGTAAYHIAELHAAAVRVEGAGTHPDEGLEDRESGDGPGPSGVEGS